MARRVGTTVTAMIDGPADAGSGMRAFAARTMGSAWEVDGGVRIEDGGGPAGAPPAGSLARVRVTAATPYDLFGQFEAAADCVLPLLGGRA
jgi:tRNA A37 methylthiotransferase MiaB